MKKIFCIALLYVCSAWQNLEAQEIGNSYLNLEFREFDVHAQAILPLKDLEFAYGKPVDFNLTSYVLSHLRVTGEDGVRWQIDMDTTVTSKIETPDTVFLNMTFRPPVGSSVRRFTLFSSIINHKILNHRTYVIVRSDWDGGISQFNPEGVGVIYQSSNQLDVFREHQSLLKGFVGVFRLGSFNVGNGFDHILFVLLMILPTPFLFSSTRRNRLEEIKKSSVHLMQLSAIFALGHTIATFCASVGWLKLPVWNVQILIAATLIVSAIHVFWPIMAGREWMLAAAFSGLHGIVSSHTLADYGLSAGRLVTSILGFNLGILSIQLLIIFCFAPWFFIAAESAFYNILKYTLAVFAISTAVSWIHQILSGYLSPWIGSLNLVIEKPLWIIAFTALASLLMRYYPWQSRQQYQD